MKRYKEIEYTTIEYRMIKKKVKKFIPSWWFRFLTWLFRSKWETLEDDIKRTNEESFDKYLENYIDGKARGVKEHFVEHELYKLGYGVKSNLEAKEWKEGDIPDLAPNPDNMYSLVKLEES